MCSIRYQDDLQLVQTFHSCSTFFLSRSVAVGFATFQTSFVIIAKTGKGMLVSKKQPTCVFPSKNGNHLFNF